MHLFSTRLARLGVTAAATAALALTTGSHAHAASYDGADPASTYCGGTTSTVSTAALHFTGGGYVGTVSLRYNSGCRTVWAKLVMATPDPYCGSGDTCPTAHVVRNSDGAELSCSVPPGATSCYTRMLNDAGVTSYAWAADDAASEYVTARTSSY